MLDYIHWDIDPEIAKIGSIAIRYYSLLFVSGLMISFYVLKRFYTEEGIDLELLDKLFIYMGVGTILGARIGHCVFYEWFYFKNHLLEIIIPFQEINGTFEFTGFRGLASHGAGIGIILSVILYAYLNRQNILSILDKMAIATPLIGAFIRVGNLMNSEIIGKTTTVSWGFVFEQIDANPRHPTQLYEAFAYLFIFVIIYLLYRTYSKVIHKGFFAGVFLSLTFTARFFIEFVKENQEHFEQDMTLNMGQLLSIPYVLTGLFLMVWALKKSKKPILNYFDSENSFTKYFTGYFDDDYRKQDNSFLRSDIVNSKKDMLLKALR